MEKEEMELEEMEVEEMKEDKVGLGFDDISAELEEEEEEEEKEEEEEDGDELEVEDDSKEVIKEDFESEDIFSGELVETKDAEWDEVERVKDAE